MPALNFHKRFVPDVESRKKRNSIRALRKDGKDARPGQSLYLYTGMQTKNCRLLEVEVCLNTTPLKISEHGEVLLSGVPVAGCAAIQLAKNDGFESVEEFLTYFDKTYGLPFFGLLIEW